ncbi:MAG: MFS transporter [Streptosporangiaceae bacterium]|nr:MFS transporter [Streptosporangiaceae bacterium]MBV9857173.1 MFS transporter [Streptosporangiaceae bacterium]
MSIRGLSRALPGRSGAPAADVRARQAVALVLVSMAQFLIALDYSIVYLALPGIAASLRIVPALVQWVVSAYAVLFAGFLIVGGRLADRFGPARMFIIAISLFGIASGAGAAAGNGAVLVSARGVQGLGAALLQPAVLGLIGTRFPAGPARSRALAVWAAVGAAGLAAGALLGGLLTTVSWRLTLLVNVPPALLCALAAAAWLGTAVPAVARARRIPLLAAALGTGTVLALALFLTFGGDQGWTAPATLACLLLAAALTGCFLRNEAASANVLIEPALRRDGSVRAGAAAAALYMASGGSEFYVLTLLLQTVKHYSPLHAGLAFLPLAAMVTAGSTATGRAVRRIRPATALTTGFLITLAGLTWLCVALRGNAYLADMLPGLVLSGFGHGVTYTATFIIGSRDVPAIHQGTAGALLTTAQYLSGALTLAVLTLMLAPSRSYPGFTSALILLAAAAGAGALLAIGRKPDRQAPVPSRDGQA